MSCGADNLYGRPLEKLEGRILCHCLCSNEIRLPNHAYHPSLVHGEPHQYPHRWYAQLSGLSLALRGYKGIKGSQTFVRAPSRLSRSYLSELCCPSIRCCFCCCCCCCCCCCHLRGLYAVLLSTTLFCRAFAQRHSASIHTYIIRPSRRHPSRHPVLSGKALVPGSSTSTAAAVRCATGKKQQWESRGKSYGKGTRRISRSLVTPSRLSTPDTFMIPAARTRRARSRCWCCCCCCSWATFSLCGREDARQA